MGISPLSPRDPVKPVSGSHHARRASRSKTTADKVRQIPLPKVHQHAGLKGKNITLLAGARELSQFIRKNWNALPTEELAGKIIDLEDMVSRLEGTSPEIAKIRQVAERLHFQFVFPVVLELEKRGGDEIMPPSLARVIDTISRRVLKTERVDFEGLNGVQIREIQSQMARRGG